MLVAAHSVLPTIHSFLINGRSKMIGLVNIRFDTIAPESLFVLG